jgi:hypothetical protein
MSDGNGKTQHSFNIIKTRGDPDVATTLTGHHVTKKERVIIPSPFDGTMISLLVADYHDEHFVYIDPLFEKDLPENDERSYWFAMCTCGSPAGIIGPSDANIHEGVSLYDRLTGKGVGENLLVCQFYYGTLLANGYGWHANQDPKQWR